MLEQNAPCLRLIPDIQGKSRSLRLEKLWYCYAEPAINAVTRESTQIVFSLQLRCEVTLAREHQIIPVFKLDMAAPRPCVCVPIPPKHPNEGLVTVRILYFVPLPFFRISFHNSSLVFAERHSKPYFQGFTQPKALLTFRFDVR